MWDDFVQNGTFVETIADVCGVPAQNTPEAIGETNVKSPLPLNVFVILVLPRPLMVCITYCGSKWVRILIIYNTHIQKKTTTSQHGNQGSF